MKNSRDRSRAKPSVKPRLSDLYCGRIVRYHNTGKSGEKGGGYGWIEKRLDPSASSRSEYPKVWFHIKTLKRCLLRLAEELDANPHSLSGELFWFFVEVQRLDGKAKERVAHIYTDIDQVPYRSKEIASEISRRLEGIADAKRKTSFADDVLLLVPKLVIQEESLRECLVQYASVNGVSGFVQYITEEAQPVSVIEGLICRLVQLGRAKELWACWRVSRQFLVQPFVERLWQAESPEESQWLIERLLEIDSAVVLKDPSLRQLAFRFASSELLLRSVNQVVASEAEDATVREIFGELEEYLTQRASVDRLLDVVRQLSEGALPAPMVERLARRLCQLGHAKELWGCWRVSRQFLVQPFIERLLQAESSEETQWFIERLLEIDSAVVLKDSSLRQLAFQFASSELLLRSVNQVVASEAEDATVREILRELGEYLVQHGSADITLHFVGHIVGEWLPASVIEGLARRLCQLGHAKELWGCWRVSRQFLVQPFIERLLQAESPEESQWLIERLLEIDGAVVLKDPSLRQLAFQSASSELLLRSVNQVVASEAEDATVREILRELDHYLSHSPNIDLSRAWKFLTHIEGFVEYRGLLWKVASDKLKLRILRNHYHKFFDILEGCENLRFDLDVVYQHAYSIADEFTEDDKRWVYQFVPKFNNQEYSVLDILTYSLEDKQFLKTYRRYYVARAAEKAAVRYYLNMGYEVEDLSILPVTQNRENLGENGMQSDSRWEYADIELRTPDMKVYVDVKSATIEDRMYYRSTFVKEFKQVTGREVVYVGVLYNFRVFQTARRQIDSHTIVVIGETQTDVITNLRKFCEQHGIAFVVPKDYGGGNRIPIYLFDYGKDFYKDKVCLAERISLLEDSEIPDWEDAMLISKSYTSSLFGILLMGRRKPPSEWMQKMNEWQRQIFNIILSIHEDIKTISMPFLLFALLIHFIKCVNSETVAEDYYPKYVKSFLNVKNTLLGILDPFSVLDSFIEMVLVPLWNKRSQIQQFKQFKLIGPQLLQATYSATHDNAHWITLVAWCENCGYFPLVFGVHPNCIACGRLICTNQLKHSGNVCYTCSKRCALNGVPPEQRKSNTQ